MTRDNPERPRNTHDEDLLDGLPRNLLIQVAVGMHVAYDDAETLAGCLDSGRCLRKAKRIVAAIDSRRASRLLGVYDKAYR